MSDKPTSKGCTCGESNWVILGDSFIEKQVKALYGWITKRIQWQWGVCRKCGEEFEYRTPTSD
jgi:hypothetical protein